MAEITLVEKVWGEELCIVNTPLYCGKILILEKGFISSYHHHKEKDETFYVLQGDVYFRLEDKEIVLREGDNQRVLPGQKHQFASLDMTSKIIEFSTHHKEEDSYRETKSHAIDLNKLKQELTEKGLL